MIYFVLAKKAHRSYWETFGPWAKIEDADVRVAYLDEGTIYEEVHLARVLEDEDKSDWLERTEL